MLLEIESTQVDNIGTLKLTGVLDISTVEMFRNGLESVQGLSNIILDFDKVKFVDSTGIGGIAQVIRELEKKTIKIKIKNINSEVFEVLDILGLPEIFGEDIFEIKIEN